MSQTQWIVGLVSVLITAGLGGGFASLVVLPKQRRQMDANTAKIVVDAAGLMINELQEDAKAAKDESRAARLEAVEARREMSAAKLEAVEAQREVADLRVQVEKLHAQVVELQDTIAERDSTIAALRRVQ